MSVEINFGLLTLRNSTVSLSRLDAIHFVGWAAGDYLDWILLTDEEDETSIAIVTLVPTSADMSFVTCVGRLCSGFVAIPSNTERCTGVKKTEL